MSIVAADIAYRYSGGAGNTDPNACLGGAISTAGAGSIDDNVKNDLFDDVSSAQALAGSVEYRGFYIRNDTGGGLTLQDARIYVSSDTTSADDELDIAIAVEAVSVTMGTIANEGTAPVGPVFSHPTSYAAGLQLNAATGLAPAAFRGVWIRRTVNAGAASTSDTGTLKVEGQTA